MKSVTSADETWLLKWDDMGSSWLARDFPSAEIPNLFWRQLELSVRSVREK